MAGMEMAVDVADRAAHRVNFLVVEFPFNAERFMRPLIEMLEIRTLLSGNPANVPADIAQYKSACATTLSDLSTGETTFHKDFNPIVADLQRIGSNHANTSLLNSLNRDGLGSLAKLKTDIHSLTSKGLNDINKIVRAQNRLLRHPSSQALLYGLAGAIGGLTTDGDSIQAQIVRDATKADTLEDTDLNAIASANTADPQTQIDVTTAKADSKSVASTAESDLGSVASAAATLVADLG